MSKEKIELELRVPTEMAGIKLNQYQKYAKILNGVEDRTTSEAAEFLNLKSLEIFCGLTLKESYGLPVSMFESVIGQINKCLNEDVPLVRRFKMTGSDGVTVEFGFIPKLDDMSFGEYLDAEKYMQSMDTMHKAMAVLYRPIIAGKKDLYLIEDYGGSDRWAEVMKDAPLNVAFGAQVFFYRLGKKLSKYTILSLHQQAQEIADKGNSSLPEMPLVKNGDGISQFIVSLEQTYEELMRLPKFHYTSA
jgi:hypothetical protein